MKNIMNARSGGERRKKKLKYKLNINYFSVFLSLVILKERKETIYKNL